MHGLSWEEVWRFETARFIVTLEIEQQANYVYDGDDEDGETQQQLDNGELVAFDSRVRVRLVSPLAKEDPIVIGVDHLGGSVYAGDGIDEFWRAHWGSPASGRNTLAMKAQRRVVCHYFPDMVRGAINEARTFLRTMPVTRPMASGV